MLVLIACGIGLAVNLIILPPMRYRSADHGVHTLAGSLHDLLDDIGQAMRDGVLDHGFTADRTADWRRRANRLRPIVDQAQAAVSTARERLYCTRGGG